MDIDVVVVGAGPTGLILGCELALGGVRTLLLERRTTPRREPRAVTLHPRSLQLMDLRRQAARFLALGEPLPGRHDAASHTPFDAGPLPGRHALALTQARTEAVLEERAHELGVDVLRGHEAVGLCQDADGVEVEVRGPEGIRFLRARFVVGCDGGRSFVRQAARIDFPGTDATLTGSDFGVAEPRRLARFDNTSRVAASYRSGRVLLAGDAAHIHVPAGGQALDAGLQDAINLGWKLGAEVGGWAPPGLLDSYDRERRLLGRSTTEPVEAQTAPGRLVPRRRRPMDTFADDPLQLDESGRRTAGASALDVAYPPADAEADPLVGRRMPDVALTARGSQALRVYELTGHGDFVLLDFAEDPEPGPTVAHRWGSRVRTATVTWHQAREDLDGVAEILVRSDGHVAWATRTSDIPRRREQRARALAAWAGHASRRPHQPPEPSETSERPEPSETSEPPPSPEPPAAPEPAGKFRVVEGGAWRPAKSENAPSPARRRQSPRMTSPGQPGRPRGGLCPVPARRTRPNPGCPPVRVPAVTHPTATEPDTMTDTTTGAPMADVRDICVVHSMFHRELGLAPALIRAVADDDISRCHVVVSHLGMLPVVGRRAFRSHAKKVHGTPTPPRGHR
ncbi:FAD-dependent monooxygenase [Streptomyces sp. NPDC050287]|uniref:FAD-dependent monooxygenase n=1 Tax=Streptomyces sp. NPDC050287 TaxID=3365608 RepID=UPI003788FCD4